MTPGGTGQTREKVADVVVADADTAGLADRSFLGLDVAIGFATEDIGDDSLCVAGLETDGHGCGCAFELGIGLGLGWVSTRARTY